MHTVSVTNPDLSKLIAANNDLGFQLLTWLVEQDAGKNVFISSFSVALALTMTYNGAEGKTMEALAELLGLSGLGLQQINEANALLISPTDVVDPKVQLNIANSIWLRDGVIPSSDYIQRIKDYYAGEVAGLDFSRPEAAAVSASRYSRSMSAIRASGPRSWRTWDRAMSVCLDSMKSMRSYPQMRG